MTSVKDLFAFHVHDHILKTKNMSLNLTIFAKSVRRKRLQNTAIVVIRTFVLAVMREYTTKEREDYIRFNRSMDIKNFWSDI